MIGEYISGEWTIPVQHKQVVPSFPFPEKAACCTMYRQTIRMLAEYYISPILGSNPDSSFDLGYTPINPIYLVEYSDNEDIGNGGIEYTLTYSEIPKDRVDFMAYQWAIPTAAKQNDTGAKPFSAEFTALDKFLPYAASAGNIPQYLPGTVFVGSTNMSMLPQLLSLAFAGGAYESIYDRFGAFGVYNFSFTVTAVDSVTGEVTFTPPLDETASGYTIIGLKANLQRINTARVSFTKNYQATETSQFFMLLSQEDVDAKKLELVNGFDFSDFSDVNNNFDFTKFTGFLRSATNVLVENQSLERWIGPIYYIKSKYIQPTYKIDLTTVTTPARYPNVR